mmetsp:Transcript_43951/g.82189  ORF Transcript_43951/g.82189 Transcript_43951/m.82189 type:complete len:114 (+) Transcript_43951:277-618(+)
MRSGDVSNHQFYGARLLSRRQAFICYEFMAGGDLHAALKSHPEELLWENQGQKVLSITQTEPSMYPPPPLRLGRVSDAPYRMWSQPSARTLVFAWLLHPPVSALHRRDLALSK